MVYFLFLAALGLCCCAQAFSSCGAQASLYGGFSLWWLLLLQSTDHRARRLSGCGAQALWHVDTGNIF